MRYSYTFCNEDTTSDLVYLFAYTGNLVGQIVNRMQTKTKNESMLIPGTNLVLYSAVSYVSVVFWYSVITYKYAKLSIVKFMCKGLFCAMLALS